MKPKYLRIVVPESEGAGQQDGVWQVVVAGVTREATAAEILSCEKLEHVDNNRAEARRRILAKYSEERQRSAALGLYPEAYVIQMQADIAAVIQAENAAADAIDAATTIAQVEAVSVSWPVI